MIKACKTSLFSTEDISILVKTADQSVYNQPCIWLVHGSGGISSNEDLWIDRAFAEGYTVIIVDSYSNRRIFKQNWESIDEFRIPPLKRALDQALAYDFLVKNSRIIPFADLTKNKAVGFSDGGTACIWLQSASFQKNWDYSYCLYPGLKSTVVPDELYKITPDNVHVFVGELDNWTPAEFCVEYQKITGCHLTIWPDTHHSFSKPGIDNWHEKTLNYKRERGVYCKYNEEATKKTMEIVFNG
jgi:dienelactone hydrolase